MLYPLLQGLIMAISLLMVIGPQNAFVLTQGIKKQHVLPVVLVCVTSDTILITIGCAGLGTLIASNTTLSKIAAWGGAAFLIWYGLRSLKAAFHKEYMQVESEATSMSAKKAVAFALGFTLLNPHVYLDTVVLIGSLAGQFEADQRIWFGIGAIGGANLWFFSLGYGARWLAPIFSRPISWRILDALIAVIMFVIAYSLLKPIILEGG